VNKLKKASDSIILVNDIPTPAVNTITPKKAINYEDKILLEHCKLKSANRKRAQLLNGFMCFPFFQTD
jgi:hypothetical protein